MQYKRALKREIMSGERTLTKTCAAFKKKRTKALLSVINTTSISKNSLQKILPFFVFLKNINRIIISIWSVKVKSLSKRSVNNSKIQLLFANFYIIFSKRWNINMKYFERIRALREDNSLTQKKIAGLLHIGQRTYSDYESGKTRIPVESLLILAEYYDVSVDYITGASNIKGVYPKK